MFQAISTWHPLVQTNSFHSEANQRIQHVGDTTVAPEPATQRFFLVWVDFEQNGRGHRKLLGEQFVRPILATRHNSGPLPSSERCLRVLHVRLLEPLTTRFEG